MTNLAKRFAWALWPIALSGCHGSPAATATLDGGAALGPPGTLTVWTSGVGRKIQPTTAPATGTSISVASARIASASSQLVVRGEGGSVIGANVAMSDDLSDGAGHTLSKSNVTFFLEYFIDFTGVQATPGNLPVPKNSPTSDPNIPDPLIPLVDPYTGANAGQPFDVAKSNNQPIFVDVYVPSGTVAGTYTGSISVTGNGSQTVAVPLSVTVWDIDLPDQTTVTAYFRMSTDAFIEYYAGIADCEGSSCYLAENTQAMTVVKRYEEMAHSHRIDVGQPWLESPVDGCTLPTDWTSYDAVLAPYMNGSYFSDGVPSSRFDAPFTPGQTYGIDGDCDQAQYTALSSAWAAHLKANGWFGKVLVYAYDEPEPSNYPQIVQDSSWLQAGDPDWKAHVIDTVAPTTTTASTLNPALGVYVVNLPDYDAWDMNGDWYGRSNWPSLLSQGIQLWFYESNSVVPPYPTFASNTMDGLEPVMAMWGSWYEKATGFLYWDVSAWNDKDPWGPEIDYGMTGDGVLVYPGNHAGSLAPIGSPSGVAIDGPIPSYRLKMIRNGLQDWALFVLADQKGLTSAVQTQVATVYSQFGGCTYQGCVQPASGFFWNTDEKAMDSIRQTVAQAIVAAP
jgi:hypothetical protein